MPTNKKNRHKMKIIQETMNTDAAVISETACTKEEKLWTCNDDIKVT